MSSVALEVKDEASNDVSGVRATIDGAPVSDRAPILVNPGDHRLTLDAPGFRRTETTFVASDPQKRVRVLVFLSSAPSPTDAAAATREGQDQPSRFASRRQKVALALGVAGVAGLAAGTTWSLLSKSTYDHAVLSECGGDPHACSAQGTADGQTAHHQAAIATVGFLAGGALLAAGAALYFTAAGNSAGVAIAPVLDPSGSLAVAGAW